MSCIITCSLPYILNLLLSLSFSYPCDSRTYEWTALVLVMIILVLVLLQYLVIKLIQIIRYVKIKQCWNDLSFKLVNFLFLISSIPNTLKQLYLYYSPDPCSYLWTRTRGSSVCKAFKGRCSLVAYKDLISIKLVALLVLPC